MLLIQGNYQIIGTSPDGDTVQFMPRDPGYWGGTCPARTG